MSGYIACVRGQRPGTAWHWRTNLTPRKAPLALIVQRFPSFRAATLAQNDKFPARIRYSAEPVFGGSRRHRRRCSAVCAGLAASLFFASGDGIAASHADRGYRMCLPARLHPVSAQILEAFLDGRLTERDFRWGFHLPNSDYLPV